MFAKSCPKVSLQSRLSQESYDAKFGIDECAWNNYGVTLSSLSGGNWQMAAFTAYRTSSQIRVRGPPNWTSDRDWTVDKQPYWFTETIGDVEFNFPRTTLVHQYGRRSFLHLHKIVFLCGIIKAIK